VTSPGGIEAWLIEDHSSPLLSVALGFRGGAALDPAGKEGLADMATSLLDEGAGDLDSEAFQKRIADLALDLSFDAGLDSLSGQMRTLTQNRDAAFDLLRQALTVPRFDAEPVERIRGQLLARLARNAVQPGDLADRVWWRTVFPDHPYGRDPDGTPASLAAITQADLRDWAKARLGRDNLVLGVVGDISAADLAPLLDKTFGALPAKAAPSALPIASAQAPGDVIVIQRPVPQSVVVLGEGALRRDDPDYYAATLVNYVLGGGGFASWLTREVREERGLAYSVSSALITLDHAGLLQADVATENARVAESIAVIREQWKRMAEEGPTAAELADAKTYLIGSFPLRLASTGSAARVLVSIQLDNLGFDYLDRRDELINGVTLEDAKRVARRLFDPARLTVVVVGSPVGVTATRPPPDAS
jgi:zinc protease